MKFTHMKLTHSLLVPIAAIVFSFATAEQSHAAAAKDSPTEAQVKDWITKNTTIRACGDDTYTFSQVQIAAPVRRIMSYSQKPTLLYSVHARYSSDCTYGDEEIRAEVDMTMGLYRDAFGNWQNFGPDFDADQTWADAQNSMRCRAQDVAALTFTSDGKVSSRTPAKDQGYMDCTVDPNTN
jgi:hypothetical protein